MNLEMLELKHRKVTMDMAALLDLQDKEGGGFTPEREKAFADLQREETSLAGEISKTKRQGEEHAAFAFLRGDAAGDGTERDRGRMFVGRFASGTKSIGEQFAKSEQYTAWIRESRNRTGRWESPVIEVKATLTEDPASGGALVVRDDQPGIVPLPLRVPRVIDLFASGTTTSNSVGYMREKVFTNAAAPVLEGGVKPESTLEFELTADPVRKIAHWLPASEEILEDVPTLMSYIDARLRLGVRVKFDDQLLNGTGVAPQILGILARPGLAAAIARAGAETNVDAILRQIAAIQTATNLVADGIVVHPDNWIASLLLKTTTGEYISGSSPFQSPQTPSLWGVQVAVTPAIAAGTALVGSFKGAAQLFLRGPLAVATTNSHADFFVKNLVAIRAEQRAALAVYVPAGFGLVTGLTPTTP